MTLNQLKERLINHYSQISKEDQLVNDFKNMILELKPVEIRAKQLEQKLITAETELEELKPKFRLLSLFNNDHGANKSREVLYNQKLKKLNDMNEELNKKKTLQDSLLKKIKHIESKLMEIQQLKNEYEPLVNEAIVNAAEHDYSDLNELKSMDKDIKQTLNEDKKYETILEFGYFLRKKLFSNRKKLLSAKTLIEYDYHIISVSSITAMNKANKANYSSNLSDIYKIVATFNELIQEYKLYLRVNIGGLSSLSDDMFDITRSDRQSVAQAYSNINSWNKSYKELETILNTFNKKREVLKEPLTKLFDKRHNIVVNCI
ncbi:hypothetical protein [Haloplasma contractile]|uniref:Uncharacterized protein n=1 Tax=Haloplasma contractile SSD-17B TaxID=1033810 RepID=F7PVK8_9MOLU|nr:hypothetical protein [Haloplasma contractile]ERJ12825.1 hypothetical protein HLPCO_001165 [Haloplasma contractile SSD-17B]